MIYVNLTEHTLKVAGHAGYANEGSDIVCSAVSALTLGLLHGLKKNANMAVNFAISRGDTRADWGEVTPEGRCLLQTYVDTLGQIADNYGHVQVCSSLGRPPATDGHISRGGAVDSASDS